MRPAFLDSQIHEPVRLQIMAILFRNRQISYKELRRELGVTDGNLATHTRRLKAEGFISDQRALAGLSFEVRYRITEAGSEAFRRYVEELQSYVAGAVAAVGISGPTPADKT